MTTFKKHMFPGWDKPVYLPDWLTVEVKIISRSVPGWTGGVIASPDRLIGTTWHDTGNTKSSATGEYTWAAGGGRAEINSPGNYTGIFDGTRFILTSGINELSQATATTEGNRVTLSFEQAGWGPGFDFDKSWEVGTYIHAGFLHALGTTAKENMYQHYYWSKKGCPGEIRKRGIWDKTEDAVDARIAEIAAFVKVGATTEAPNKRTFTLRFDTYLRTTPGFWDDDKNQNNVIKLLEAGVTGTILEGPKTVSVGGKNVDFYNLDIPGQGVSGTGWLQDQVLHTLDFGPA